VAEIEEKLAEVGQSGGEIGLNLEGPAKVVAGLVFLIERAEGRTEVGVTCWIVGPQCECSAECVRRFAVAAERLERESEVVKDYRVVQAEPERGEAAIDDAIVVAQGAIGFGESRAKEGGLREQADGATDQFGRLERLAELKTSDSQQMEGIGVGCVAVQKGLVEPCCGNELARLVKLDRTGEFVA
jgi:hypothetical protein